MRRAQFFKHVANGIERADAGGHRVEREGVERGFGAMFEGGFDDEALNGDVALAEGCAVGGQIADGYRMQAGAVDIGGHFDHAVFRQVADQSLIGQIDVDS